MIYKDLCNGRFYNADTFEAMAVIPDNSIDMILVDLPYGTTDCSWDTILPFDRLWAEYKRICKTNAAMVFTGSQPFTSMLVTSNIKDFKVEWIWEKNIGSNFINLKFVPMKEHENIIVFSNGGGKTIYNQIKQERKIKNSIGKTVYNRRAVYEDSVYGNLSGYKHEVEELRSPSSVQYFEREVGLHPTQKPVALFEYFIRTYSNKGDTVLDNTAGSGTTAVAAYNTDRKWICIEQSESYYNKAIDRIERNKTNLVFED